MQIIEKLKQWYVRDEISIQPGKNGSFYYIQIETVRFGFLRSNLRVPAKFLTDKRWSFNGSDRVINIFKNKDLAEAFLREFLADKVSVKLDEQK